MFVLIVVALVTLVVFVLRRRPARFPPGPLGLPAIGYLPFLGANPAITYMNLSKKYGPIFSVQIGPQDFVVLNNYEAVQEAYVKRDHEFSGRPYNAVYDVWSGHGIGIAFIDCGPRWKTHRAFAGKTLRRQGTGKSDFEQIIAEEARSLNEVFLSIAGKAFDPKVLLSKAAANVIMAVAIGSRVSYDDKAFNEIVKRLNDFITDDIEGAMFGTMIFFPAARHLPGFRTAFKKFEYSQRRIREVLKDYVDEHKLTFDPENPRDFIDEFLNERNRTKNEMFSDEQLIQTISEFFQAGTESFADTIMWCLLVLGHFPEHQEKISNEIYAAMGTNGVPSTSHRKMMPYTCAFIQELQRMYSTTPLSVPRRTTTDVNIRGYKIPKHTPVVANLYAVHTDPTYFKDPNKFRPERFIDSDGKFLPDSHVIPFSLGPRNCVGEQIARKEGFVFLVSLIKEFRIVVDPEKPLPPLNKGTFGIAYSPLDFEIRLVPK